MKIALALPRTLRCLFVVAVERMPCPVESVVPWRVGPPYRRAAMSAFGTPWLSVTHHRSPWSPGDLTLTDDERHLLRRTRQHVVVTSSASPRTLPAGAQVARAAARALAHAGGGLVIDPLAGTTVPLCDHCPNEPSRFRLADDWLGWDVHHPTPASPRPLASEPPHAPTAQQPSCRPRVIPAHQPSHRPPHTLPHVSQAFPHITSRGFPDVTSRGFPHITSRGLRRFALPEITLDGAPCTHTLCAITLLRTVADRLVTEHLAFLAAHPHATTRLIDDHLRIDGPDPSSFPGAPPLKIRLTPCDEHPPASTSGPFGGPRAAARPTTHSPRPANRNVPRTTGSGRVTRLKVGPLPGTDRAACLKVGPAADPPITVRPRREAPHRPTAPRARRPSDPPQTLAA
ncbi:hypothetical protein FHU36_007655 [Nonomuraea muscovyensis]|uniref:Uncharacterized protein n=1 Tax=Nonomuraea muscovyensis TaxID=1124761 RepID=A0A7X0CAG8_9ACTN|nr:hypothetical protein [Nonomuraea muscovyensis]MBB6351083.1 hypothetical protein [Nonomuraea muscovyensis]